MDMPHEVRIGRHVTDEMQTTARAVIALVHARLPLASARIYKLSPAMYKLSVLPAGRSTLIDLDFRVGDRIETRAEAVLELVARHSDMLDKADLRNALPIEIERVVAAYVHHSGDGAWFRTAVRHAARRTQLRRDHKGVVPAWPEVLFGRDEVLRPEGATGIKFTGAGTPGLVGLRLTLPAGTPILRSFDDVAGVPVDELVDDPLVNGAGLVAMKAWKSDTADRALGRITITVKSDPIALDEAARLVDRMRAANNRRGVDSGRTNFRANDPGYEIPEGCLPENPRKYTWDEIGPGADMPAAETDTSPCIPPRSPSASAAATPAVKPDVTREREIESLTGFLRAKGLEQEWIATLIAEEAARKDVSTPEVDIDRQERDGRRYFDASINITPWLMFAAVEDVVQLVGLRYDDLEEGGEDRIFLDGICDACEGHRDDQDEEYHIPFPDSWDYNVWGEALRREVRAMIEARRPDILPQVEAACDEAARRESLDIAA